MRSRTPAQHECRDRRRRRVAIALRDAGWRSNRQLSQAIESESSHLLRVLGGERPASAQLIEKIVTRIGASRWGYIQDGGALLTEEQP